MLGYTDLGHTRGYDDEAWMGFLRRHLTGPDHYSKHSFQVDLGEWQIISPVLTDIIKRPLFSHLLLDLIGPDRIPVGKLG